MRNLPSGQNNLVQLGVIFFLLKFEILQNYFVLVYPFTSLCLPFRSKALDLGRFRQRQLLFQDIFLLLICASYVIQKQELLLGFFVGLKGAFMFMCIRYNQGASSKRSRNVDCPQDVRLSCLRNLITGTFITYG